VKSHLRKKHKILEATIFEEEVINDKYVNPGGVTPFISNHRLRLSNKRKHTIERAESGTSLVTAFLDDGTTTGKEFKRSKCIRSVDIDNRN
jgi:hypothetical protein